MKGNNPKDWAAFRVKGGKVVSIPRQVCKSGILLFAWQRGRSSIANGVHNVHPRLCSRHLATASSLILQFFFSCSSSWRLWLHLTWMGKWESPSLNLIVSKFGTSTGLLHSTVSSPRHQCTTYNSRWSTILLLICCNTFVYYKGSNFFWFLVFNWEDWFELLGAYSFPSQSVVLTSRMCFLWIGEGDWFVWIPPCSIKELFPRHSHWTCLMESAIYSM